MKRSVLVVLAVLSLSALSVYAEDKPRIPPPPLRVEVAPERPGPSHVWVPGYWKWSKVNYAWVDGRWVKVKPNRIWIPGEWKQAGSYWAWTPGRWEKVKPVQPKPEEQAKKK
jgi:hypothetical protein